MIRIRAELEVCSNCSGHHGLQVPLLQVSKTVAISFVHSSQNLCHAFLIL